VIILNPWAFPSNLTRSFQYFTLFSSDSYLRPFPFLKYSAIASSPECPKGGFPISCARQAAATISPKWKLVNSAFNSLCLSRICFPMRFPSDLPMHDTSRL